MTSMPRLLHDGVRTRRTRVNAVNAVWKTDPRTPPGRKSGPDRGAPMDRPDADPTQQVTCRRTTATRGRECPHWENATGEARNPQCRRKLSEHGLSPALSSCTPVPKHNMRSLPVARPLRPLRMGP